MAPAYDASSSYGSKYVNYLAFGLDGQARVDRIGPRNWLAHARGCGVDEARTLDVVRGVVDRMPDAVSEAIAACAERDENRLQEDVDRRARAIQDGVAKRCREFNLDI